MTNQANDAARDLATRYWEGYLELQPFTGTYIGDDRYDDRLPDPSDEGIAKEKSFHESALADLAGIDRSGLDEEMRLALDLLEFGARRSLDDIAFRIDRLQVVGHLFGPASLLASIGPLQRVDTPERLEKYLSRLSAMPAYFAAVDVVADEAARIAQTSPGLVVDRTIAQVERMLRLPIGDSPAMEPVKAGSDADRERVATVLREEVLPAHARYLEVLRRYRPFATETIGVSELPDGEAIYASQIKAFTTLAIPAQRIHDIGLEELAKIQEERRLIARSLGFPDASAAIAAHTGSGKNVAVSRDAMIAMVEDQVRRSWDAAPRMFGRLPRANCEVRKVEEFREDDMPGAFYMGPSQDGSRAGIYYLNTSHLSERPLHQVATTTYHEANPGHHFQISIEMEYTHRLPLRRFGGDFAGDAFVEGWGLYSERVADELGLFVDGYERLGMLDAQGTRACRLIVDTGIHALDWDRERAVRQMQEGGLSRMDSEIEVDRYISWPGQALAYMIGQLEIQKWRTSREKRLGGDFSVTDFHDRLLSLGSLPLATLEREMEGSA